MGWITANLSGWRALVLIGLLVALVGPWTFSGDGVPPPEWCDAPHILLVESNRCVRLIPGVEVVAWLPLMGAGLLVNAFTPSINAREFSRQLLFVSFLIALLLPVFSTLLLLVRSATRGLRSFQVAALGLAAALAGMLPFIGRAQELAFRLWGVWLYTGVAIVTLIVEAALWARRA